MIDEPNNKLLRRSSSKSTIVNAPQDSISTTNPKVKTVKLNLKTTIKPPITMGKKQKAIITTTTTTTTADDAKSSKSEETIIEAIVPKANNVDPQPKMQQQPTYPTSEEEILLKILKNPKHGNNAFMEAVMRRHENSLRRIAAEAHDHETSAVAELEAKNQKLIKEKSSLVAENEKLRIEKELISQDLIAVRESLFRARSECDRMQQTITDLEELMKKQEEIHVMELKKLQSQAESAKSVQIIPSKINSSTTKSTLTKPQIHNKRKTILPQDIPVKRNTGPIPTKTIDLLAEAGRTVSDCDGVGKRTTITTSDATPQSMESRIPYQLTLEERLATALQAQAEAEEKLLKREEALRDVCEKNKLLMQHFKNQKGHYI